MAAGKKRGHSGIDESDTFVCFTITKRRNLNTILETMATGLPVVAVHTGGNPEIVTPRETGKLIPHSNPVAIADAIGSYFSNPCKVSDHGRNGREKVKCQFSMQAMIKGYISTYDEVLSKTAGTSHVGCGSSNNRPL
jgi:glycosyltransferase involved in cell wall biosynthesis